MTNVSREIIFAPKPILVFLVLLACQFVATYSGECAEVYAVHYPPLMIRDGGERPGFAIEIIQAAEKRLGEKSTVRFYTFARMTKTLLNRDNGLFPTLYRNPQREEKFQWIAKVFVVENSFMTTGQPVNSLEQARQLDKIGVVDKTALHEFLLKNNFTNLEVVNRPEINARKLAAGRIDAWFLTTFLARMIWNQEHIPTPLVAGVPITRPEAYIAANLDFPKPLAKQYRLAIVAMHRDGTIKKIVRRYGLDIDDDQVIVFPTNYTGLIDNLGS